MNDYELTTNPDIKGFQVMLLDGTLIGYVDEAEDGWIALSVYDETLCVDADSEEDAAGEVWRAYSRVRGLGNE